MTGLWAENPLQKVPDDLAVTLIRLREARGGWKDKRYNQAMRTARLRGWTVAALAVAVDRSPASVAQLIHRARMHPRQDMTGVTIPWAPKYKGWSPNVEPAVNVAKAIGLKRTQELRRLHAAASRFRGQCRPDHPSRLAAAAIAAEIYKLVFVERYPIQRVAVDLFQVTPPSLTCRLRTHGYPGSWAEYHDRHDTDHDLAA